MRRLTSSVPVVTSVLVGAAVLAAVWVTNARAVQFFSGGVPPDPNSLFVQRRGHHRGGTARPKQSADPQAGLLGFDIVGYIMLGLFVLVLLAFVANATVHNRRGPRVAPKAADDVLGAVDALSVPAILLETTAQQLAAIRQGSPRNAIVACWWELERSAAATGFPRAASETSSEFTQRVLTRYLVETSVIEELAALYREARFSEHVITEDARDRAIGALERILADLRATGSRPSSMAAGS